MFALLFTLIQLFARFIGSVYHSLVPDMNQHFESKAKTYHPYPHLVSISATFNQRDTIHSNDSSTLMANTPTQLTIDPQTREAVPSQESSKEANNNQQHQLSIENTHVEKIELHSSPVKPQRRHPFLLHMQSNSRKRLSSASLLCRNVNWNGSY